MCPKLASSTGVYCLALVCNAASEAEVSNLKSFGNEANILIIINLFFASSSSSLEREKNETWLCRNWLLLASDHGEELK